MNLHIKHVVFLKTLARRNARSDWIKKSNFDIKMNSKSYIFNYKFYKRVNIGWSKDDHPQMYYVWLKHNCFRIDRRPIVVHNTFCINYKILESTQPFYQDVLWNTQKYYNAWFDVFNLQSSHKSQISHIYRYHKRMLMKYSNKSKDIPLACNHIQSIHNKKNIVFQTPNNGKIWKPVYCGFPC